MDVFMVPDLESPGGFPVGIRVIGSAYLVFDGAAQGMLLQSPLDTVPCIYPCPDHGPENISLDYMTASLGTQLGIFPATTLDDFPASDDAKAQIAAAIENLEEQAVRLLGMDIESVSDLSDLFGDDEF